MAKAVVALGSNLPGRFTSSEALLEAALEALTAAGLQVTRASSVWRSAAWPDASAPEFRNRVALVETALGPERAMIGLLAVERAFGRERGRPNAARTLDLDLIDYDGRRVETAELRLPHPRAHERFFVMGPLAEVSPQWMHPLKRKTAERLAAEAWVGLDAHSAAPER